MLSECGESEEELSEKGDADSECDASDAPDDQSDGAAKLWFLLFFLSRVVVRGAGFGLHVNTLSATLSPCHNVTASAHSRLQGEKEKERERRKGKEKGRKTKENKKIVFLTRVVSLILPGCRPGSLTSPGLPTRALARARKQNPESIPWAENGLGEP